MDIEQKMDLIQQIHREQMENERNFYKKYNYKERDYSNNQTVENEPSSWVASFRLRLLLAVLLFLSFFVMDKKEIVFEGIGCIEIIECISSDFSMENWIYKP